MHKIKITLKYILYLLLTTDDRMRYNIGQAKGCYVSKIESDSTVTTVHYHPSTPNRRDYSTWAEFKEHQGWNAPYTYTGDYTEIIVIAVLIASFIILYKP